VCVWELGFGVWGLWCVVCGLWFGCCGLGFRVQGLFCSRLHGVLLRGGQLPWREAGPPNHHDNKVDSDQQVVKKELFLRGGHCRGAEDVG